MATKLTEITTQYHTFVDNQVLTKDQLNEFINYFEDQDRMSRIFLCGTGIVCGFNISADTSKPSVFITQGTGITTDGDLLKLRKSILGSALKSIDLDKIEFTRVKKFEDNFAHYRFFKHLTSPGKKIKEIPIDLWELHPEKTENTKALSTLAGWNKMVVLLYLESFADEGDLCTAIDCDNQGVEQVARLRVLLVSKTDADFILGLDSVFSAHHKINTIVNLPDVAVRRVVLNKLNTASYDSLKNAYYTALTSDSLYTNLSAGIKKIVTDFKSLLKLEISETTLEIYLSKLKNIAVVNSNNIPFNIQYRYDCIKDMVDTYHEIKSILFELNEMCNPDINAFPKHLMLGSLDETESEIQNYRHQFYSSPAVNSGKNKIKQCRSLVLRLFQIIDQFKTLVGEIKITPSQKLPELSNRSIPFYYHLNTEFLKYWNFFKTEKLEYNTNLCYHKSLLSSSPQIQEPLYYNVDGFDFYRIEGHQGKDYKTALEEIDDLKVKYGLPFQVKALSVNVNREILNIDDYECEFEDLNVLLKAWTAEQNCVLAEVSQFFSGFSTAEPGKNLKEPEMAVKDSTRNLLNAASANDRIYNRLTDNSVESAKTASTGSYRVISNPKGDVVTENLVTDDNALGSAMKKAIEENPGGSVNDIITKAENLLVEKLNTDTWKEQPEIKDLVIDKSIRIMAYSHVITQKMPGVLSDLSVAAVDDYKITLKELCAWVEKLKKIYQTVNLTVQLKALMSVLITHLSSVCCSAKKLEVLLDEINKRKENIIVRLQLSKFVENCPGLEHNAGVTPGGTFFLIYITKTQSVKPQTDVSADFRKETNTVNITNARTSAVRNIPESIEKNISKETSARDLILKDYSESGLKTDWLNRAPKITDLPENTVVADFSLPYLCCSDCTPINFIIEKPPVTLRLNSNRYCLGKDSGPLIFEVSPADGVIKANPEVAGIKIEGTKLLIDSALFPKEMLGQKIKFTVNDQITSCEVTVYQAVIFDFKVPELPVSETEITFVPSGNLDGATFLWSFGDDNLSTDRNPTHKYVLPVNNENKVTVSLTVTAPNGICQTTKEHEIVFVKEETKISLADENFCENDKKQYPFTITPAGVVAKIEGGGVKPDDSGGFVFIPANAGAGIVEFKLDGELSGVKAIVHLAPVAALEAKQVENRLIITNNSLHAKSFVWFINGEKLERDDSGALTIELTSNSPNEWKIKLQANSEFCGTTTSGEVLVHTKFIEEPVAGNCIEETKASILANLKTLSELDISDSESVHSTWLETSRLYGGTREFRKGVLNDIDNFLSGKNNGNLLVLFEKIWFETVKKILSTNRVENKREYNNLIEIFGLQLQLFYNILGCQSTGSIKESEDLLNQLLDLILELLGSLKNKEVKLPKTLREFVNLFAGKVKETDLLKKHISILTKEKLI